VNYTYVKKEPQEAGNRSEPVVVNKTDANRPYRLGPVGYERGRVITLIFPLTNNLEFFYAPQSFLWERQEFVERLASAEITLDKILVPQNEGILVSAELVIQFPSKQDCDFVCCYYSLDHPRLGSADFKFEDNHIIHFNRSSAKSFMIDNWR
jgi:hypothetical protein